MLRPNLPFRVPSDGTRNLGKVSPGGPRYFPPGFHWSPRPYLSYYVFEVASGCHRQLQALPGGSGFHRLPLKMPWSPVPQVRIKELVQGVSQRTPSTKFTTEF